jgi:hypothetical protein
MRAPHKRIWTLICARGGPEPAAAGDLQSPGPGGFLSEDRLDAAVRAVRRGLLQAEEKYLVDPGATLGTWFARVQETVAVAFGVTLSRIEESRPPSEEQIVEEQIGLHADICAEAIRAAAQLAVGGPSAGAREEILRLVSQRRPPAPQPRWAASLECLARCTAALEPLANGLREGDLPMGEPTDCDRVTESLLEAASQAFGMVHALC